MCRVHRRGDATATYLPACAGTAASVRRAREGRLRQPSHRDPRGVGRYSRCLLDALRDTAGARGEIVETHRPRRADVFHAPWMQGAMLHSPCPMVVTIHDLTRSRAQRAAARWRHPPAPAPSRGAARDPRDRSHRGARPRSRRRARVRARAGGRDPGGARSRHVDTARQPSPAPPAWTWQDVGRETWRVYESALARPERPCVGRLGATAGAAGRRSPRAADDRGDP